MGHKSQQAPDAAELFLPALDIIHGTAPESRALGFFTDSRRGNTPQQHHNQGQRTEPHTVPH